MRKSGEKKILVAMIVGVVVAAGALIAAFWYQDYLRGFEIVRIENYPDALPVTMRENLEKQLRGLLDLHFAAGDEDKITATVREGTYREDEREEMSSAEFVIDIDEYQQTYAVVMNWSTVVEVPDAILIACPDVAMMKYPEQDCKAMYNDTQDLVNAERYPLYGELPIIVDDFDFASRSSIHYEMRGYFNEQNELVMVINDYSGGNYEAALSKIRALGYSPEEYIIEYYDKGGL